MQSPQGPWDALLLRVVDGALAGSIFLVPFLMGGRQPGGHLVLAVLAVAAAVATAARSCVGGMDLGGMDLHGPLSLWERVRVRVSGHTAHSAARACQALTPNPSPFGRGLG